MSRTLEESDFTDDDEAQALADEYGTPPTRDRHLAGKLLSRGRLTVVWSGLALSVHVVSPHRYFTSLNFNAGPRMQPPKRGMPSRWRGAQKSSSGGGAQGAPGASAQQERLSRKASKERRLKSRAQARAFKASVAGWRDAAKIWGGQGPARMPCPAGAKPSFKVLAQAVSTSTLTRTALLG